METPNFRPLAPGDDSSHCCANCSECAYDSEEETYYCLAYYDIDCTDHPGEYVCDGFTEAEE